MEMPDLVQSLVSEAMRSKHGAKQFIAGASHIPVTGKVFGEEELRAAVNASLEFWLTSGPYTTEFESKLAKYTNTRNAFMVNSGSSANLVALSALTSPSLGSDALKPGDEIITVAAGFPTTVTPIIQNRLVPVFVDVDIPTYVANTEKVIEAISPKTRGIMMAHTLGNPFEVNLMKKFGLQCGIRFINIFSIKCFRKFRVFVIFMVKCFWTVLKSKIVLNEIPLKQPSDLIVL